MSDLLEKQILEADDLFATRRWDEALARYEEILKSHPADRRALNRTARIHACRGRISLLVETCFRWQAALEDMGHFPLAAEVSNAILRFDPHSVEARTAQLRHLEKQGDDQGYKDLARREARFFMEVGQGEISLEVLNRALERFPADIDLEVDLADMCVAQGHLQEAVQHFRRLAGKFEGAGNPARAADALRRLKLLLPDAPDVSMRMGGLFLEQGRFDDAIAEFRNVLKTNLAHRDALMGLADASMRKGSQRDAILAYRKVLATDNRDADAHQRLGEVYVAQGMTDEAIKELLAAGMILAEFEEYKGAQEIYRRVLQLDPEHPTAVRELSNAAAAHAARETRLRTLPPPPPEPAPAPAPGPLAAAAPVSVSEEDLYAAGPASASDDLLLAGGAPEGEDLLAGPPEAPSPEPVPAPVPQNGPAAPRLVVDMSRRNGLLVPTPIVFMDRLHLLDRIRQQIAEAPDPDALPWKPLPDLERVAVTAAPAEAAPARSEPAQESRFGPVRSAFGITDGFSQAQASGGAGRGRRRSWDFLPSGRGPRSDAREPMDPANRFGRPSQEESSP